MHVLSGLFALVMGLGWAAANTRSSTSVFDGMMQGLALALAFIACVWLSMVIMEFVAALLLNLARAGERAAGLL